MTKNLEIPLRRGYTGATAKLRALKVGENVSFAPAKTRLISGLCSRLGAKESKSFTCRSDGKGVVRVWRVK